MSSTPGTAKTERGSPLAKPASAAGSSGSAPLISLSVLDAPAQRLYALSFFALAQAYKILFLLPLLTEGSTKQAYRQSAAAGLLNAISSDSEEGVLALPHAALVDFVALFALYKLRIPRLSYGLGRWAVVFALLTALNYTIVTKAAWVGTLFGLVLQSLSLLVPGMGSSVAKQLGISENWIRVPDIIAPKSRILGQVSARGSSHSMTRG